MNVRREKKNALPSPLHLNRTSATFCVATTLQLYHSMFELAREYLVARLTGRGQRSRLR